MTLNSEIPGHVATSGSKGMNEVHPGAEVGVVVGAAVGAEV